jgi:hypothetical protein
VGVSATNVKGLCLIAVWVVAYAAKEIGPIAPWLVGALVVVAVVARYREEPAA